MMPGWLVADVSLSPDPNALPGGSVLQTLVNGLGGWALLASLAGLVIGAAVWAIRAHSQNYQQAYLGRRAVLVAGATALLVGAAPAIINFFFHLGLGVGESWGLRRSSRGRNGSCPRERARGELRTLRAGGDRPPN
jgi:hypothetical protein